jgi:hypothetical protein
MGPSPPGIGHAGQEVAMRLTFITVALAVSCVFAGPARADLCSDRPVKVEDDRKTVPAPADLVALDLGGRTEVVWPYTSADLSVTPKDPLNLVFLGAADPRQIRAALFALDGDRSAFGLPNAFPFNCTWSDAIGRHQAGYAEAEGWQGSGVALQCGAYETLRVHMRLFREGNFTLANAHFEALIPGTTDHEVLSWELSQQMVTLDMGRTGLLGAPPALTAAITPAPSYRAINPAVFNGVPAALRFVLGLPTTPQSAPVPIPNDGKATLLQLAQAAAVEPGVAERTFVHPFNQIIPKPFCASGPFDYLKVEGPLDLSHRVTVGDEGEYTAEFAASGVLQVTPIDPRTGATGPTFEARIHERHHSSATDQRIRAEHVVRQYLLADPLQAYFERMRVGPQDAFERDVDCGS